MLLNRMETFTFVHLHTISVILNLDYLRLCYGVLDKVK